ncbi:MAG: FHA domain-containing protein [Ruminococcaceae bacterium]|nr:FHA domain-containing protein [Oscillospiraceae bacterium]
MEQLSSTLFYVLRIVLSLIAVFVLARCFTMLMRKKVSRASSFGALYNAANGDEIEITGYETSIGRSKLCDIKLGYATVSRFHAVLAYRKGRFFVFDTNSKMGVFVNGVKIDKPTEVFNGDNIAFGNIPMKLLCEEDEKVEPLDEKENRYINSVIADTSLQQKKARFDTDDIPSVYDGAYLYNGANGERLHLIGDSVIFGRDPSQCDLPIDNPYVSRVHARLFKHNGRWAIEDLNSTSGTYLNSQKLDRAVYLDDGDIISLGGSEFRYGEGGIR